MIINAFPSTVHTARLVLRRPVVTDVDAYFDVFGDAKANATNQRGFCHDHAAAVEAIAFHIGNWDKRGFDIWTVCRGDDPSLIIGFGGIGLRFFGQRERLNLGYGMLVSAWGKGYASELSDNSVRAAKAAGFEELWARVQRENGASRKILENVGLAFKEEGSIPGELWYRTFL